MFKVGDRIRIPEGVCASGLFNPVAGHKWGMFEATITEVDEDGYPTFVLDSGQSCSGHERDITVINKGNDMNNETTEKELPEFILIVKNTEMFKKGGVLKNHTHFWAVANGSDNVYNVEPYDTTYIRPELGRVLLEKKIAVPAVEFNPAFVTMEQNAVLQKALAGMNKTKKVSKK